MLIWGMSVFFFKVLNELGCFVVFFVEWVRSVK